VKERVLPTLEKLEQAADSLGLPTLRKGPSLQVALPKGFWSAGVSLDLASGNGRATSRIRRGSISEWPFRFILLACVSPMIGYIVAHPHDAGVIPALGLISSALIPCLIQYFMIRREQKRLFRRAAELEGPVA
jgi:hypothetical protein